jgi:hypothetical protein
MAQLNAAEAAAAAAAAERDELRLALEQHKGPWMDEVRGTLSATRSKLHVQLPVLPHACLYMLCCCSVRLSMGVGVNSELKDLPIGETSTSRWPC